MQVLRTALLVLHLLGYVTSSGPSKSNRGSGWQVVNSFQDADNVEVKTVGPRQQSFARPPPNTLDPYLLRDYEEAFNVMQDISPKGENMFQETSEQYIAILHDAFVEGESGLVYDSKKQVYHVPHFFFNRTNPQMPLPHRDIEEARATCTRVPRAASVIQRYGHMYYHFLAETIPRVSVLIEELKNDQSLQLLSWGEPYEGQYYELMGLSSEQILPYDPGTVYCIDELLIPTPTPRITPPWEALVAARSSLGVKILPEEERNLIIYVSREGEDSRQVSNESELIAKMREYLPDDSIVIFRGDLGAKETIALFEKAKAVVGFHGAGLTHIMFSGPDTIVVEMTFLDSPPLMFWHIASALREKYWLIPVAQTYWMVPTVSAPVDDVISSMVKALGPTTAGGCSPGWYKDNICVQCQPGRYYFNNGGTSCHPCPHGSIASKEASTYCKICPPGTFSNANATACESCPDGTSSMLAGAWEEEQCVSPERRRAQLESQASNIQTLLKLSPLFAMAAKRRALVQGSGMYQTLNNTLNNTQIVRDMCLTELDARLPYEIVSYGIYQNQRASSPYLEGVCDRFTKNESPHSEEAPVLQDLPPLDVEAMPPKVEHIETLDNAKSISPGPTVERSIPAILPSGSAEFQSDTAKAALPTWAIILLALAAGIIIFPLTTILVRRCSITGKTKGASLLGTGDDTTL